MANVNPTNQPEEINQSLLGSGPADSSCEPLFRVSRNLPLLDLLDLANCHLAAATEVIRENAIKANDEAAFGGLYLCEGVQALLNAAIHIAHGEKRAADAAREVRP